MRTPYTGNCLYADSGAIHAVGERPDPLPCPWRAGHRLLGRSNVGKSSLINSLVGAKLARTSNTPGRTRSINFYEVRRAGDRGPMIFADLPGYGYAKISREISADWARFVDPYLHRRSSLALCLVLVDANVLPQESDGDLLEFLTAKERPYALVATKCDRLSGNQLSKPCGRSEQRMAGFRSLRFRPRPAPARTNCGARFGLPCRQFPAM